MASSSKGTKQLRKLFVKEAKTDQKFLKRAEKEVTKADKAYQKSIKGTQKARKGLEKAVKDSQKTSKMLDNAKHKHSDATIKLDKAEREAKDARDKEYRLEQEVSSYQDCLTDVHRSKILNELVPSHNASPFLKSSTIFNASADSMEDGLAPTHANKNISLNADESEERSIPLIDSRLFSYIRATFAKSPIGSLFQAPHDYLEYDNDNTAVPVADDLPGLVSGTLSPAGLDLDTAVDSNATAPRRLSCDIALQEVKQSLSSLTRHIGRKRSSSTSGAVFVPSPSSTIGRHERIRSRAHTISTSTILSSRSSRSTLEDTPPLTPASSQPSSSAFPNNFIGPAVSHALSCIQGENTSPRTREESRRIREGKRPQRPICYDALIADISNDVPTAYPRLSDGNVSADDSDEWYGLAYTLELSRQEQESIQLGLSNDGEFSKSHRSWAAIHRGLINPLHEYEEYHRWKKWHRALDHYAEKRRIQRTFSFLKSSKDMAEIYVDEIKLRRWYEWHKARSEDGPHLQEARADLAALSQHRADPYHPPVKHDLAWATYRSRSSACLRELRSIPEI
ncbi:hypothetical protein EIP91_006462 [Steccherinum ochraceum]|uniref:Uncharacterized protein n=1 Tax=Steccherinum ochraceum TaxID=92696 RepID=A0A4V2MVM5_9APHY|nr:hypothetical protein EIP91_006462 [Steccherinum ochraceum]